MQDKEIDNLEQMIPLLASGAVKKAYLDNLSAGNIVLEVLDGILYEVYPDGQKKKIKDLPPLIEVDMNKKVYL